MGETPGGIATVPRIASCEGTEPLHMDEWDAGTVFGARIPFVRFCGIEAVRAGDGETRLRLVLGPDHANNLGIAHGGILCTLLDVAMGTAARLAAGRPVVTLDLQTRFLDPGRGTLEAVGRVTRAGASVIFAEAEIRDESGRIVASATGVLKTVAPRDDQAVTPTPTGQLTPVPPRPQ